MADPKPVLEYRHSVGCGRYVVIPRWLVWLHRVCCGTGDIATVVYGILFGIFAWLIQAVLGLFGCALVTQRQMDEIVARRKVEFTSPR